MRLAFLLALLASGALAAPIDDLLAVVAAQESPEAWPGIRATEAGLPEGAALLVLGAVAQASPEIGLTGADVAAVAGIVAGFERPERFGRRADGTLPEGARQLVDAGLVREQLRGRLEALRAEAARVEQRIAQIDGALP